MTKNMLTYLSHQFCINCCGESKKNDCDTRYTTCDKLAGFLVGCHKFQEPIDKKKLDALTNDYFKEYIESCKRLNCYYKTEEDVFKDGYRKAMEGKV